MATEADATTDTTDTTATDGDATSTDTAATDTSDASDTAGTSPHDGDKGDDGLGDAGKKAIDAMKARMKAAEAKAREAAAELAAVKAKAEGTEAEHQAAQEAQRVKDEALASANDRIKKAEVRAAAAGKLQDPKDALLHLDLSEFEVDDDGEVDSSQIAAAIEDLIKEKPYLAAQGGKRFQGGADGGARNDASKPSQLTADEVKRMSPEEIDAAETAGRLDSVLGRT